MPDEAGYALQCGHSTDTQQTDDNTTMTAETPEELMEQFDVSTERNDPSDIPDAIYDAMLYIDDHTGLLGDYHTGIVTLTEDCRTIQWYPRSNMFSMHDKLLHWVQEEQDELIIAHCGTRTHPTDDERGTVGYIEIHEKSRWGYDDE